MRPAPDRALHIFSLTSYLELSLALTGDDPGMPYPGTTLTVPFWVIAFIKGAENSGFIVLSYQSKQSGLPYWKLAPGRECWSEVYSNRRAIEAAGRLSP